MLPRTPFLRHPCPCPDPYSGVRALRASCALRALRALHAQVRGSVLAGDGLLFVRLSPQFKPFVDGWVAALSASDGSTTLLPFALDHPAARNRVVDHPPPSALAAMGAPATPAGAATTTSGGKESGGQGHGGFFPPYPYDDDDGPDLCFRSVLKKAALPFREDPSLGSPVVGRLPLGGVLRGGQRLVTKEGQAWAQCWLPIAAGGDQGQDQPVWAVERNAKDGPRVALHP